MKDEFGGIAIEDPPQADEFGGVAVAESVDEFGGVAVSDTSAIGAPTLQPSRFEIPRQQGISTTQGGGRAPLASFKETMVAPVEAAGETLTHKGIPLPRLTITEDDSTTVAVGKEVVNLAIGIPEFFTSALGIGAIGGTVAAPVVTAGAFTVDLLHSLGQQVKSTYSNWDSMTKNEKAVALTDIAGTGAFATFTGTKTVKGVKAKLEEIPQLETPAEAGQRAQLISDLNTLTPETAKEVAKTEVKPEPLPPPKVAEGGKSGDWLDKAADSARERLKLKRENPGMTSGGIDPEKLDAYAIIAAQHIRNGVKSAGELSAKLGKEFEGWTGEHAQEIWDTASQVSKMSRPDVLSESTAVAPEKPAPVSPPEVPPAKQKLPVQDDMAVTADQLKIASENIDQLLTRGNWTDEIDVKLAKGRPADPRTKINVEIDEAIKSELVASAKRVETLRRKAGQQADPVTQNLLKLEEAKMKVWLGRFQESGRTWHDIGMSRQRMAREMAESSQTLREMIGSVKQQLPVLDQIWKDLGERKFADAGKHFADYLRMNLFTLGSWTLDFGTNLGVVASHLPSWAALDVVHFVTGQPAQRMLSALRSVKLSSKNLVPWNERFRLPEKIERDLGTTAGGEFEGRGKEIMVDFSEILKSKPELASKLKPLDAVISAPVRMKRAVDNFFGRFGATAELYNSAYTAGRKSGLNGDALKSFVDDFIKNPPDVAAVKAVKAGKEFKFNRDLTAWEERFANNLITKLVVETFPRWTFQFTRWAGEMIGANPAFFKDVVRGKANHEAVIDYLSKAATGWGAIYGFGQLFYDDIDANTMEYVDEHGDRTRLSGRTPAPELFLVNAILRGDMDKAKAAFAHVSLPGAKLLSGEPAGLISPLVDTMRESFRGRYTAERTAIELTKLVNDMFPGKSVLGFIRSFFDPTIREGIGSPIPGVSSALPQRINPTTGEPLAPKQRIPGTKIELPTVGGTPFPGAVRVLNDIEKALTNHGMALTRPRRTSLIELPAEDVSKEVRREYEKLVGKNVKQILGEGIRNEEWKAAPFEIRREILSAWLEASRAIAKAQIADKYGASSVSVKSVPLNIQRLPENLKR